MEKNRNENNRKNPLIKVLGMLLKESGPESVKKEI